MALSMGDLIDFGKAILAHWRTHFPAEVIGGMTLTEFEAWLADAEAKLATWREAFQAALKAAGPRDVSLDLLDEKCQKYRDGAISVAGRGDSPAMRQLPQEDDYQKSHAAGESRGGGTATLPTP